MHRFLLVSLALLLMGSGFRAPGSTNRPNILLILADDLGFSDLGCYGGEIETPHLDRLAKNGVRFSAYYNSARCCPSRASLMTGLHPHQAGIGSFATAEPRRGGGPAYAGHLLPSCATLAEMLGAAGYSTWMVGKWHMGIPGPIERGFQNYYGYRNFLAHSENQWDPEKYVRLPEGTKPELTYERDKFYVTDVFTDYALEFLKQARSATPDTRHPTPDTSNPWFLYLAHSSPHFPIQAPVETIDKYVPTFREGWDKLREARFERQKKLGLVAPDAELPPLSEVPVDREDIANGYPGVPNPPWDSLDADRREDLARRGAIFAAMVEHVDRGIGRILADLEQHGELENTLILFTSDNGACYEWGPFGFDGPSRQGRTDLYQDEDLKKMGQDGTHQSYGSGWANLGNTALNMYKHFCHEGGIASPLIAHWPKGIARKDAWVHDPAHIMDLVPTVLAASGAKYPAERDGTTVTPVEGISLLDSFGGKPLPERALAFEHQEARGLRKGDWKIVWGKRQPDPVRWELYNLKDDRSEQRDLAKEKPELTAELVAEWEAWAKKVGADPFARDDAGAESRFPQHETPEIANRALEIACDVEAASKKGVIVAHGGREQGYALHLLDGVLAFDVRIDGKVTRIRAEQSVEGRFTATARLDGDRMQLAIGEDVVASAASPGLIPVQPKDGLNVGYDDLTAAGDYDAPNRFEGTIHALAVTTEDPEEPRTPASPQATEPLKFVPFHEVRLDDPIWRPRTAKLVQNTLPHAFKQTEVAQERLRLCAEWIESGGTTPKPAPHRFNTSDLYKVMEGAALMIKAEPNAEIEALTDRIIDVIARAQKDDGYLYVSHITGAINEGEMGPRPYSYVIHSHELYNVGHLYEAAVAYAQATGKTKLLAVAEKSAQHVNRVFFEGDPAYNDGKPVMQAPGHQEIEIGLLKLHQFTGKPLYLEMARKFLAIRGVTFVPDGEGINSPTYAQQHQPVADQREAVGHAVRAGYQYAAMAEVDSLRGTDDFTAALDGIWHDLVDRKMHITGGLGAVHGIEGFGPPYVLPNKDTYLETCAAVANVFFNMRMFLKYGDARFVDVGEVSLLNNALAGVGLDGTSFFYPNPLEADHGHAPRSGWFGTACCPSNIARLIPQVAGYMYAVSGERVACALYARSSTSLTVNSVEVDLRQETEYPYDGEVTLHVDPKSPVAFELALRIPTWARERFVPGELYSYLGDSPKWSVAVNGEAIDATLDKGFVTIKRTWKPGDRVELELSMPVHASKCLELVEANRNRVAITRGPLVFCAEGIDNDGAVQRFFVNPRKAVEAAMVSRIADGPLQNLPQIVLPAREVTLDGVREAELTMIPYFAWSNRDRSSMITWLPTSQELAKPDTTSPKSFKFASATASHTFELDTVDAVRMPHQPKSSADTSIPRWTSWPQRGTEQWVEIDLDEAQTIRSVGAYWYDDAGGVQVPGSWHLEIPDGDGWKSVAIYNTDTYSALKDTYNTVRPAAPLKTDRLRLVMKPQHDQTCVGLLSVTVETSEE